jgi:hypothetical protein
MKFCCFIRIFKLKFPLKKILIKEKQFLLVAQVELFFSQSFQVLDEHDLFLVQVNVVRQFEIIVVVQYLMFFEIFQSNYL